MSGKRQKSHSCESNKPADNNGKEKNSGRREIQILKDIARRLTTLLASICMPSVRFCQELQLIIKMLESKRQEGMAARTAAKAARRREEELEKEELAEAKRHAACT